MRLFISTLLLLCHFSTLAQNPAVRLEMSNGGNTISTMIIFFNGATTGYDAWYDAPYLDEFSGWQFGSLIGTQEINTNVLPLSLLSDMATITVPLFFETTFSSTFTISLMQFDNMPSGWVANLIDDQTGISHELSNGAFSFAGNIVTSYNRFTLNIENGIAIYGCMDDASCNYDSSATIDDGSCDGGEIADDACDCEGNILDECGVCGGDSSSCSGCTNANATNYDSTATIEDGTCLYDQEVYDVALALCPECINEDQIDEGFTCIEIWEPVCGCNDVTYSNDCYAFYNGVTEWTDGECELLTPYNPDFDNDDIIGVNDLLALLSVFGSSFVSDSDCGNGIVEDGECCDDGNDIQTDGCNACQCEGSPQDE